MLKIWTVPCRVGFMDNYSYILQDEQSKKVAIIDPSEVRPIINKLNELNLRPDYVLNTHHHFDHTDGNHELKNIYHCQIIGNIADQARIPDFDIGVTAGKSFALGDSVAQIIAADGHTKGHILYYFPQDKALFTGDTLFNLCIGGLFEGTVQEMFATLQRIKDLPDDTLFYAGHEYTFSGASEAYSFCDGNETIRKYLSDAKQKLDKGLPVGPTALKIEKQCNPYLAATDFAEFIKLF